MKKGKIIRINDPRGSLKSKAKDTGLEKILAPIGFGAVLGSIILPGIGGLAIGSLAGVIFSASRNKEKQMAKIPVFYSFHFDNDVMRVQQIRHIGSIEGNSPTTPNEWEKLKRTGTKAVENWIEQNMKYKRCVIVLIGSETANRPWVQHEIVKAWNDGRALLGIYIHNVRCPNTGISKKGKNPFDLIKFSDGRKLSSVVPCYEPNPSNAYSDISANIATWIELAIKNKEN